MRTTPLGIVMLNDEREHVYAKNNPLNMRVVKSWAKLIEENVVNVDKSKPEVIVGSEIITSIRSAQKVGEELSVQFRDMLSRVTRDL